MLIVGVTGLAIPIRIGKKETIDLNKLPPEEIIDAAIGFLKKELPGLYDVLIEKRNEVMARNLKKLQEKFDNIVCVIGAGHEKGMKKLL